MSITGMGSQMGAAQWSFLLPLENVQSAESSSGGTSCSGASSSQTSSSTDSSTSGSSMNPLSSEILALLIQLQAQSGSAGASASSSNATTGVTGVSATTSSTTANPISSFFSSLDTDGSGNSSGTISQSQFESFIENLGGTQSEADTLFTQLTQNNNANGLSEQQLAQDAFGYGPPPPPPPSAGQVANNLVNAMGGSNGQVTKSEFENFVTSNGGTTSEADQDFAALDTSGSSTLSAGDLEKAIENQQQQTTSSTSSTSVSLLSWLDSLSATASGSPSA